MKTGRVVSAATDTISGADYDAAVRIGTVDGDAVYWEPHRNYILRAVDDDDETQADTDAVADSDVIVEQKLSRETVGEYIRNTSSDGVRWELNDLGDFMRSCGEFYGSRILTVQQEEAFALRRFAKFEVDEIATALGISEQIVESRLTNTQKRISCAFNIVESIST